MLETLSQSIGIWGYAVLFFYSFGGGLVALIAASILSSGVIESINSLNIYVCIFIASIANFIGSSLLFYMARYQKKEVMKYFSAHRRKIALSHIWIKKYSYLIIFIHKYLYGIKTIIPLVIGFSKFDSKKFLIYNFFASFVWGILIGGFSYAMGDIIRNLYDKYSNPYIFPIVGIIIIVLFFILANKITKKV
ncbi:DedA family protein [Helicobacter sp. MIT 99-5507]|nr:DedA family protein [Helicobacter sp. MIT 99-5507]